MARTFTDFLKLPAEQSEFEKAYLDRMNRIALGVCLFHVPVIALVAYLAGTSVAQALVFTAAACVGPLFAMKAIPDRRHVSAVFGFTAMCLSALMIHFGQGPMQIEMHFHVFVFIALLAVFANPLPILVAAGTIAVQHLLFYFLLPRSVFNYEASVFVVLVHALFVVAETVAACFIARSFFDNVIGLEKIVGARTAEVDQRNRDMRLILDNAEQGFLTAHASGELLAERSAVVRSWFGEPAAGAKIWDVLAGADAKLALDFKMAWEALIEDVMPIEVSLAQMPTSAHRGGRSLKFQYRPILDGARITKVLVVVTDATAEVESRRAELIQRETMAVFERIMQDRLGFVEFVSEAGELLARIGTADAPFTSVKRWIHTLKGNCGVFGMSSVADVCHRLESRLAESDEPLTATEHGELQGAWTEASARIRKFLGERRSSVYQIEEQELRDVLDRVTRGAGRDEIATLIQSWRHEPLRQRFQRFADQAQGIADRLGKGHIDVEIDDSGLRLDPEPLREFWGSFIHSVRNAVDHGLESETERQKSGKAPAALRFAAGVDGDKLRIELRDNGRGIDWEAVRARAARKGLRAETRGDLVEALFADGLTTKDDATEVSGRGVGMGALREACRKLGGGMTIASEDARGTAVVFEIPLRVVRGVRSTMKAA